MDFPTLERASALFAALGHPTRLRMVELLCHGERTVNEVAAALEIPQPGASQHLAVLARAGVLTVARRGAARIYRVRGPRIARTLQIIEEFCAAHDLRGPGDADTDIDPAYSDHAHAADQPDARREPVREP